MLSESDKELRSLEPVGVLGVCQSIQFNLCFVFTSFRSRLEINDDVGMHRIASFDMGLIRNYNAPV